MNRCESAGCEGVARFIFHWTSSPDSCDCSACSEDYVKRLCKTHTEVHKSNLTVIGSRFAIQSICIMEET